MSHYKHLSIEERENLYLLTHQGMSIRKIAEVMKRAPSTISRELKRGTRSKSTYRPSEAQRRYKRRRMNCGRKRLMSQAEYRGKSLRSHRAAVVAGTDFKPAEAGAEQHSNQLSNHLSCDSFRYV